MSLTKLSLAGNNLIIDVHEESLVSDIPAGDRKKTANFTLYNPSPATQREEKLRERKNM
jgi:hypothetical protein